ncbi:MAG: DUF2283 domain-containing protein [Chloroflexi bacterium]|nr:DUF2283 domain-containing protein [Chloroflexota bacterium]
MSLYFQKDEANDQIYIGMAGDASESGAVKKSVRISKDIVVDLDESGHLLGIDISNASIVMGKDAFKRRFEGEEIIGVAEAAKLCRVKKPNFIRDYANRRDFPSPVASLASGRLWYKSKIVEYLSRAKQKLAKITPRKSTAYDCLVGLLAVDELVFRHSALTYLQSILHPEVLTPPTIERIAADSIQEDISLTAQAQAGDVDLYVDAAWKLLSKYSASLQSYVSGLIPKGGPQAQTVSKAIWVEALQEIQRGSYGPKSESSFTAWLLDLTNAAMRSHGVRVSSSLSTEADPLGTDVRSRMYEEALRTHQTARESARSERLVLEYLSRLSVEELADFLSTSRGMQRSVTQVRELIEKRRSVLQDG